MPLLFAIGIIFFAGRNLLAWCICLPMAVLLGFMATLVQIRQSGTGIAVKRFFRWWKIPRSEITFIGESRISGTGFVELNRYVFPWGRIYFQMNWADKSVLKAMAEPDQKQRQLQ